MSRAAWLVAGTAVASLGGSVTLTGCAGDDTDGVTVSAVTPDAAASPRPFACGWLTDDAGDNLGPQTCNAVTEVCLSIEPCFGAGGGGYACSTFSSSGFFPVAQCGAHPTCACSNVSYEYYEGYCSEDDAGDITAGYACPCYGCPAARLERLASVLAAA
jgi:hypothetical protein